MSNLSMQYYAAVSDVGAPTSSKTEATSFISPQLQYQQWFQQQIQQQAAQQSQQQQNGISFPALTGDGSQAIFTAGYLDPHSLDFHALNAGGLNANINGQIVPTDAGLSLSALQSIAGFQLHTSQGQTFMVPSGANLTVSSGPFASNEQHMQGLHHQHQQAAQQQTPVAAPKKKGPKTKAAPAPSTPTNVTKAAKPPKPKGTPNAYAIFYKETYAKLRQENPEWKASQIMAEAGKIWKDLNGAVQDHYRSQAESLVQAHNLAYPKTSGKKQKNGQKRPMTAYQLFIREQFSQRPSESSTMHAKDILMQLSGQWKNLPDEVKKVYQDRAQLEKARSQAEQHASNGERRNGDDQMQMNDVQAQELHSLQQQANMMIDVPYDQKPRLDDTR